MTVRPTKPILYDIVIFYIPADPQTQKYFFFEKPDCCPNTHPKIFKLPQIFQINSQYLIFFKTNSRFW